MEIIYFGTSGGYASDFYYFHYPVEQNCQSVQAIRHRFWLALAEFKPVIRVLNPLPILMRAINSLKLKARSFVPRWRSGRWKSKT